MNQKAFYKMLVEFSMNPARTRQWLADKRLTLTEKKIIEGQMLIRNNQNQETIDLMKSLPTSELPFVEAQRKLLMARALNNLSHFGEAEKTVKESIQIFNELDVPYFQFMGQFYLFNIYSNRCQTKLMLESLKTMESLPLLNEYLRLKILRSRFDYYSLVNEIKAREVLAELEPFKKEMSEADIISQLVCEFMFYVKFEEFDHCEIVLNEMKKYRKFNLTENFNFMKMLLAHLKTNAPIYLYDEDFKHVPLLHFQLKIIHSFEEKNLEAAKKSWHALQTIYPETYKADFEYVGGKCLFSLCLDKHRHIQTKVVQITKQEDLSQLDSLVNLLMAAQVPLSKGHIYEFLWNEFPEDKDEMKKLTRLISRARSERGIEIKSRKGTYFIDQIAAPKTKIS